MSVNKVILIGRLGQDPELKYTPSGAAVCNFSLATSEKYKDKSGQQQEKTEWHRVVAWAKTAELCGQYLAKGRECYLEGRLETRSWEQDGVKKFSTEVIASSVQFLGGKSDNQGQAKPQGQTAKEYDVSTDANFTSDSIPF